MDNNRQPPNAAQTCMDARRPDPYVYPGTSILISRPGIRDAGRLEGFKRSEVQARSIEFSLQSLPRTLDLNHVQLMHQRLFGNIFEWAGAFRTVPLAPDRREDWAFRGVEPHRIVSWGKVTLERIRESFGTPTRSPDHFAEKMATAHRALDQWTPFRAGNDEVFGVFSSELARSAGYQLDWSSHVSEDFNHARRQALQGSLPELTSEFRRMAIPPRALSVVRSTSGDRTAFPWDDEGPPEPYRYPNSDVPINIPGIRDAATFLDYKDAEIRARLHEMPRPERGFPMDISVAGLQGIHRALTRNIYYWAGELDRAPPDEGSFARLEFASAQRLEGLRRVIENGPRQKPQLVTHLAATYAALDEWKPFWDESHEALRIFTNNAIRLAGYRPSYARTPMESFDKAVETAHTGDLAPLRHHFDKIVVHERAFAFSQAVRLDQRERALQGYPELDNTFKILQKTREAVESQRALSPKNKERLHKFAFENLRREIDRGVIHEKETKPRTLMLVSHSPSESHTL